MAFDKKIRVLWAVLAIPGVLLYADETFWRSIKDSRDSAIFAEFLKKFSNSPHAQEARAKLEELRNTRSMAQGQECRCGDR